MIILHELLQLYVQENPPLIDAPKQKECDWNWMPRIQGTAQVFMVEMQPRLIYSTGCVVLQVVSPLLSLEACNCISKFLRFDDLLLMLTNLLLMLG